MIFFITERFNHFFPYFNTIKNITQTMGPDGRQADQRDAAYEVMACLVPYLSPNSQKTDQTEV